MARDVISVAEKNPKTCQTNTFNVVFFFLLKKSEINFLNEEFWDFDRVER